MRSGVRSIRLPKSPLALAAGGTAVVGIVLAVAGISLASIPGSGGVISACYTGSGSLHTVDIIDASTTSSCPPGWTSISWNQAGQPGSPGAQGSPGPAGSPGTKGSPGTGINAAGQVEYSDGSWVFGTGSFGWSSVAEAGTGHFCMTTDDALGAGRVLVVQPVNEIAEYSVSTTTAGCDSAGQFEVSISEHGHQGDDTTFFAVAIAPASL